MPLFKAQRNSLTLSAKLAITPILATLALAGVAGAGWRGLILEHSRDLARDVKSISHATSDQADQVRSLNDALAGLDTDTQGNAALVEEASASAQLLREQAQQLQQLVATFQLRSA